MQAYAEGFEVLETLRVRPRPARDRRHLALRLGRALVAARAARRGVRAGGRQARADQGLRRGLRRGPLDDRRRRSTRTCPVPVITLALFARFASRQDESFAAKVNAALRNQFGGHAVQGRGPRADRGQLTARASSNPLSRACGSAARPEPCALVIFGASGDLTQRKLMPALYALAVRHLLPAAVRDRRRRAHRGHRRRVPRADEARRSQQLRARRRSTGASGTSSPPGCTTSRATSRTTAARTTSRGSLDASSTSEHGDARQPHLLPRRARRARSRRSSTTLGAAARRRRAGSRLIIEKPFGHDLASARELNSADRRALRRERGLPHRPLPRQGDGAEHAGAALRQRHLRADLEPPVHRPRADHGRRVDRDRGPRRLLRAGGRDPRHLPEPPAAAARAHRDGAADRLHRRLGAQREGEGAAGRSTRPAPEVGRPRPVRARASSRASRCPATARRTASRRDSTTETFVAAKLYVDNWRWADTPFYVRMGKRLAAPRDDDRDPVQARAAPAVRGGGGRGAAPERAADPRPAERGHLARDRREGARARG